MNYIGEHLLPGQLGHFFTILSLIASLVASVAYLKANKLVEFNEKQSWLRFARAAFLLETISVVSIFCILYYLIANHYHEYYFAWNHSSRSLPSEYLLSCIWEDQSGSFLLWNIWHCVLGWIIIWRNKKWEAPVMTVVNFAQFCIATMMIGIYIFGTKIGNNPFALLRNELNAPMAFQKADYLQIAEQFKDYVGAEGIPKFYKSIYTGNDLNTLLQNYWMVIHPPVLFLGFASTLIPFAFAYAGLINKDHSWTKFALPWTLFSVAILGTGIMMGAAWAYESLSFGGYWAWDPVENASLVPWITMVAGLHTNLIYKSTGYSLRSTYFFYIVSFTLVLYSTFLTRSGILGDTSVHAFTGADMTVQLVLFVLIFFIPALILFFKRYKSIPTIYKEENTYSREFWMFIGSLVLFLSSIVIAAKTSVPVFNKIFNTKVAPPEEVEFAYNRIQIFVAIIIGLLTAITQYFKYKDTPKGFFSKKILLPTSIALIISVCISVFGNIDYDKHGIGFLGAIHVAIFASVYAVVANASYIWIGAKGKLKLAGASVAHVGFGLILVGVLISSAKKNVLSVNTTGVNVFEKTKQEDPAENITLFKGIATDMGKYMVTYERDTFNTYEHKRFFEIDFKAKKGEEHFKLYPDLISNNKGQEGFSPNPDKKHYWYKDIFVYISAYPKQSENEKDTATFISKKIKIGDTLYYSNGLYILDSVANDVAAAQKNYKNATAGLFLNISVISKDGRRYKANPGIALSKDEAYNVQDSIIAQSLFFQFNKIADSKTGTFEIAVKETTKPHPLITLKVYEFPMINILWIGIIVMVIGTVMAIRQRMRRKTLTVV
jgi:cytochrome c-type biogenesis protein CcmF